LREKYNIISYATELAAKLFRMKDETNGWNC
jgi:hypothetical protein